MFGIVGTWKGWGEEGGDEGGEGERVLGGLFGWFDVCFLGGGGRGCRSFSDGFWGRKVDILSLFAAGGREGAVRFFLFLFLCTGFCGRGVTPFTIPYPLLFSNPAEVREFGRGR